MSLTLQDKQDIAEIVTVIVTKAVTPLQVEVQKHSVLLQAQGVQLEKQGVQLNNLGELVKTQGVQLDAQGVLLEASEERGSMALSMLSAQLASELKSRENEMRIEDLESGQKVLRATVKYHQHLLKARLA